MFFVFFSFSVFCSSLLLCRSLKIEFISINKMTSVRGRQISMTETKYLDQLSILLTYHTLSNLFVKIQELK